MQVIKEASSPAAGGMEAPTSPVMPCKMELDKVMVSKGSVWINLGSTGLENPEFLCGAAPGAFAILTAALQGWEGEQELDIPALCRGMKGWQCLGDAADGILLSHSGCPRRSTPRTRTVWPWVTPGPRPPAGSTASTVQSLSPCPPSQLQLCAHSWDDRTRSRVTEQLCPSRERQKERPG